MSIASRSTACRFARGRSPRFSPARASGPTRRPPRMRAKRPSATCSTRCRPCACSACSMCWRFATRGFGVRRRALNRGGALARWRLPQGASSSAPRGRRVRRRCAPPPAVRRAAAAAWPSAGRSVRRGPARFDEGKLAAGPGREAFRLHAARPTSRAGSAVPSAHRIAARAGRLRDTVARRDTPRHAARDAARHARDAALSERPSRRRSDRRRGAYAYSRRNPLPAPHPRLDGAVHRPSRPR
ncbi:hypothetical protein X894_5670 [Burkholderia pseudomallei MSHR4462]|nr:hypothetical protein X894_5670 [Burkholderia pseudomallei MSHR4462]KGX03348.1 hypothetical protein Y601_2581 [Burkholderia pseudomallei MSHR640]